MHEGKKTNRKYRLLTATTLKLRLLTAQREEEVMGMEWGEIEPATCWWTIPESRTKNKLAHRVFLTPQSSRLIEEARTLCAKKAGSHRSRKSSSPSPYVFPGPRGGHISNVQKAIDRIRETTGIDFRGHDLRRTAATQMTSMGIPRSTVKKILNHVEPGVTKIYDRYSYDNEKREALETWARRLMVIVSGLKEVESQPNGQLGSSPRP